VEFKFDSKRQYFTVEEERKLKAFIDLGVKSGIIYKNEKGEVRTIARVEYPEECVISGETHYGRDLQSGGKAYCTPIAALVGVRTGYISYRVDGKYFRSNYEDFVKWAKGGLEILPKAPKPVDPNTASRLEMAKGLSKASVHSKEEFKEKAKHWNPTGKKLVKQKKK